MTTTVLYCDAACNPKTGSMAWASVVTEKTQDAVAAHQPLFRDFKLETVQTGKGESRVVALAQFDDVRTQHINGGELIAMVMGLRIATQPESKITSLYSDSTTILAWSQGRVTPKTAKGMSIAKKTLIDECTRLRTGFQERGGCVLFIDGDDNPADLGFHVKKAGKKRHRANGEEKKQSL